MSRNRSKYSTARHQDLRKKYKKIVDAGAGYCCERMCLSEIDGGSRWIEPGTPWDVCHDVDGVGYIGPGHSRCNRSEGASRGNKKRFAAITRSRRWEL